MFSLAFYYFITQTQYLTLSYTLTHTYTLAVWWLKGQVIGSNSRITCQPRGILTEVPASAKRLFAAALCVPLYFTLASSLNTDMLLAALHSPHWGSEGQGREGESTASDQHLIWMICWSVNHVSYLVGQQNIFPIKADSMFVSTVVSRSLF